MQDISNVVELDLAHKLPESFYHLNDNLDNYLTRTLAGEGVVDGG
jgi:hypothetical protein